MRARVAAGLEAKGLSGPAYVLARDDLHVVMAGALRSRANASAGLDAAAAILGEGGFVREISKFCPGVERVSEHVFRCAR